MLSLSLPGECLCPQQNSTRLLSTISPQADEISDGMKVLWITTIKEDKSLDLDRRMDEATRLREAAVRIF